MSSMEDECLKKYKALKFCDSPTSICVLKNIKKLPAYGWPKQFGFMCQWIDIVRYGTVYTRQA